VVDEASDQIPVATSASEVRAVVAADQAGKAYLLVRRPEGELIVISLEGSKLLIGRDPSCEVALEWDPGVSRVHAELQKLGDVWTISDDGMSSNGTFIGSRPLNGRHRLRDGEVIRIGGSLIGFRDGEAKTRVDSTRVGPDNLPDLTSAQMKVLIALVLPVLEVSDDRGGPATNQEIADELFVSIDTVKGHLKELFKRFALEDLPQNRKRAALVERAITSGLVTRSSSR
jgi:hypothetical protein